MDGPAGAQLEERLSKEEVDEQKEWEEYMEILDTTCRKATKRVIEMLEDLLEDKQDKVDPPEQEWREEKIKLEGTLQNKRKKGGEAEHHMQSLKRDGTKESESQREVKARKWLGSAYSLKKLLKEKESSQSWLKEGNRCQARYRRSGGGGFGGTEVPHPGLRLKRS